MRVRGIPGRLLMQEADELIARRANASEVMTGSRTMTIAGITEVRFVKRSGEPTPLLGTVNKSHEIAATMRPNKLNVVTMKAGGHPRLTVGNIINEFDISARASLPLRVLASPLTLPRHTLLRRLLRRAARLIRPGMHYRSMAHIVANIELPGDFSDSMAKFVLEVCRLRIALACGVWLTALAAPPSDARGLRAMVWVCTRREPPCRSSSPRRPSGFRPGASASTTRSSY
mgnify:CR=1 FL=1